MFYLNKKIILKFNKNNENKKLKYIKNVNF